MTSIMDQPKVSMMLEKKLKQRVYIAMVRICIVSRKWLKELMDWVVKTVHYLKFRQMIRVLEPVIVVMLFMFIGFFLWDTFRDQGVSFAPVQMPQELVDMGYTPRIVAQRLIDSSKSLKRIGTNIIENKNFIGINKPIEVNNRIEVTNTTINLPPMVHSLPEVDIVFPVVSISLNSATVYLRELVPWNYQTVNGEMLYHKLDNLVSLRLRIDGEQILDISGEFSATGMENLFAQSAYELIKQIRPNFLALYHYTNGQKEAAKEILNFIFSNYSVSTDYVAAINLKGIIHFEDKQFDEAFRAFNKAIEFDPNYTNTYNNWGYALALQGDLTGAIEQFKKAFEINPNNASTHNNWGGVLLLQGDLTGAIEQFKKAFEINPNNASTHNNWGGALASQGDFTGAIEQYKKAVDLNTNDAHTYINWGNALARLDDHTGAIEQYKKAIKLDPNDSSAYINWGYALARLGDHTGAIEQYKKAVNLNPNNVHALAYTNWGNALAEQDDLTGAIEQYKKAIELDPSHTPTYYNWGNALALQGDLIGAIELYKKAIDIDPNYAPAYYNWGQTLELQEDLTEAIEMYKKAIDIDPNYALAYINWGNVLAEQGDLIGAIEQYNKAVNLDPNNVHALVYTNWGNALAEQDDLTGGDRDVQEGHRYRSELCPCLLQLGSNT